MGLTRDDPAGPFVHDDLDTRSMHFGALEIQSRMRLADPDALLLDYTRTMMGALAYVPQPRDIAFIGLGGGSLVKFCHRHLPDARLVAVEIDPQVIALRDRFMIPPDGPRLRVVESDGRVFVADTGLRFDVLMLDAFDAVGLPAALSTRRFYDDCADLLRAGGVLVANLHSGDPDCDLQADRIALAFGGASLRVDDREGTNSVVFACKPAAPGTPLLPRLRRPAGLDDAAWRQVQPAFSRIAHAMQRNGDA